MKPRTREFNQQAAAALVDSKVQASLNGLYDGFYHARQKAAAATPDWEAMRVRARAVKAHTLDNLDYYLEMVDASVTRAGGTVFFASEAADASGYILDLARARGVRLVIKGKSMLSEEMGLNQRLSEMGVEPVETDLGEFIIQLADETPYHIIATAIHKSREEVSSLFHDRLGTPRYEKPEDIAAEARRLLRDRFVRADMGITGANFVVAETGTLVLVTN